MEASRLTSAFPGHHLFPAGTPRGQRSCLGLRAIPSTTPLELRMPASLSTTSCDSWLMSFSSCLEIKEQLLQ